jgi:hypothetical protein
MMRRISVRSHSVTYLISFIVAGAITLLESASAHCDAMGTLACDEMPACIMLTSYQTKLRDVV